jgi:hypothetical protein
MDISENKHIVTNHTLPLTIPYLILAGNENADSVTYFSNVPFSSVKGQDFRKASIGGSADILKSVSFLIPVDDLEIWVESRLIPGEKKYIYRNEKDEKLSVRSVTFDLNFYDYSNSEALIVFIKYTPEDDGEIQNIEGLGMGINNCIARHTMFSEAYRKHMESENEKLVPFDDLVIDTVVEFQSI